MTDPLPSTESTDLQVRSLGSGSSGNAVILRSERATIAIDCGVGPGMLRQGLESFQSSFAELDALLVTHEHIDHVRSLPSMIKSNCAIVSSAGSARATGIPAPRWSEMSPGRDLTVGDMVITMIPVSHDAAEPCGYHIHVQGRRVTVVTDLGEASEPLQAHLEESDLIIVEANHDEDTLRRSPYPERLKRRILAPTGHLSNADAGRLLAAALRRSGRAPTIWLAHLSTTNNRPALAKATVERALREVGSASPVSVLPRRSMSTVWTGAASSSPAVSRQLRFEF